MNETILEQVLNETSGNLKLVHTFTAFGYEAAIFDESNRMIALGSSTLSKQNAEVRAIASLFDNLVTEDGKGSDGPEISPEEKNVEETEDSPAFQNTATVFYTTDEPT
jgi:hypothetical protein